MTISVGWFSNHMCIGVRRSDDCRAEANMSGLRSFLALPIVIRKAPALVSTDALDRMTPEKSPRARKRNF